MIFPPFGLMTRGLLPRVSEVCSQTYIIQDSKKNSKKKQKNFLLQSWNHGRQAWGLDLLKTSSIFQGLVIR
ncbi:hypothetical protein C4K46_08515 [Streptococcus oricebi]|uniref:Uncharacterized protein n=1 Tax=Streptococcus oricebi TaxID=1547447 RepID=A0ABS5B574_9STRE|nr:hypothetical protein [Streptococcus oricebi]